MTTNHDYNTPKAGTTDWHIPLNENFKRIDTAVEMRDVEANLDQYVPKQGAKFLATDTGRRYLGDGSDWHEAPVHVGDVTAVPAVSSDPTDVSLGELWYRSDSEELRIQTSSGPMVVDVTPSVSSDGAARVLDDFEGTDPLGNYRGDTGAFSIVESPVFEGSHALHHAGGSGRNRIYSRPGDGLPAYLPKGTVARVYFRFDGLDQNGRFLFRVRDEGSHFFVEVGSRWDVFRLVRRENGGSSNVWQRDVTYEENTWYEVTLALDDGSLGGADDDVTARLRAAGSSTILAEETTNTSYLADESGLGLEVRQADSTNEHLYCDYIHTVTQ